MAALALTPVGVVNAMTDDCDMDRQAMSVSMSTSADHSGHMMHSSAVDEVSIADSCCDNASICSADCDASLQVGVIGAHAVDRTINADDSYTLSIVDNLLIRELSPPSRPPAKIHS